MNLQNIATALVTTKTLPDPNFVADIRVILSEAKIKKIDSDDAEKNLIETGSIAKRLYDNLESKRKTAIEPYQQEVKDTNAAYKPFTDSLKDLIDVCKEKINEYRGEKKRKAEEEQRRIQAALDEAHRKEVEEAKKNRTTVPTVQLEAPTQKIDNNVKSDTGSAAGRRRWTFKVVNLADVPIEHHLINAVSVNDQIRKGVRSISGLEIYQEESISLR
jgi:hypothetical protein